MVNPRKITSVSICIGMLFCLSAGGWAQEEVRMKVRSEGFRRIVLAVSPFASNLKTELSDHLRQIILNDLDLSGYFQIIDLENSESRELGNFRSSGKPVQVPTGAAVLLDSRIDFHGNAVSQKIELKELSVNQRIMDKSFDSPVSGIRQLGHRVADEISYYLTGDRGIARTKIAFVSVRNEAKEIAVVDYDGSGSRRITSNGSLNLSPSWSPDGKQLAFTSYASGRPDLAILGLDDGRTVRISEQNALHSAPDWSPDGKQIALTLTRNGDADIYVVDVKKKTLRQLTHNPSIDSSPSWSPNGREIAFTSGRSGSPQIYIMDSDGSNVRRLTYEGGYNESPAWSPRGDVIVFVSRERTGFQIYSIDANGENLQKLTDSPGNNENPSWSPNGMWIAFASNRTGRWDIYIIRLDGSLERRLTEDGGNVSPCWSPVLE